MPGELRVERANGSIDCAYVAGKTLAALMVPDGLAGIILMAGDIDARSRALAEAMANKTAAGQFVLKVDGKQIDYKTPEALKEFGAGLLTKSRALVNIELKDERGVEWIRCTVPAYDALYLFDKGTPIPPANISDLVINFKNLNTLPPCEVKPGVLKQQHQATADTPDFRVKDVEGRLRVATPKLVLG